MVGLLLMNVFVEGDDTIECRNGGIRDREVVESGPFCSGGYSVHALDDADDVDDNIETVDCGPIMDTVEFVFASHLCRCNAFHPLLVDC